MKFEHRFRVRAPLSEVGEFHYHPSGLKALTPPLAFMRFDQLPDRIGEGKVLKFRMWLGPIPIRWESHFPAVTPTGFVDTQGIGPFSSWEHKHTFGPIAENVTEVEDCIEAHLRSHLWHGFVGLLVWITLPLLFVYRQRQTRRILERKRIQVESE
jgi:ligand-binding SRPBCC domain-containing protein